MGCVTGRFFKPATAAAEGGSDATASGELATVLVLQWWLLHQLKMVRQKTVAKSEYVRHRQAQSQGQRRETGCMFQLHYE
jgi:hypothetical protein